MKSFSTIEAKIHGKWERWRSRHKNYQSLEKGLREVLLKYITTEFIKILNKHGPNPAPRDVNDVEEAITKFFTTHDETYKQQQMNYVCKKESPYKLLGIHRYLLQVYIHDSFNSKWEKLLCHFPRKFKGWKLDQKIEMELSFILTWGKTDIGRRLPISSYFSKIVKGRVSIPNMIQTNYSNKTNP